jgi:hypothetical protein
MEIGLYNLYQGAHGDNTEFYIAFIGT